MLTFFDLQTTRPFVFKVDAQRKQLLFGGVIPVRRMHVTAQQWGVSIECEGGCAGVEWVGHEEVLNELAYMAVVCNITHNIPPQHVPKGPLFLKQAKANQGGRLCLKEGLIEKLLTSRYGCDEHGWVDSTASISKAITRGGVKALTINSTTMNWKGRDSEEEQGVDEETPNRLETLFVTAMPPKPPPPRSSGSANSRRSDGSCRSVTEASSVVSSQSCDTNLSPLQYSYIAYVSFKDAPEGLFLSRNAHPQGTPVVVSAFDNGTEVGTVSNVTRIRDVTSCGDVEQHIIRKASEAEVKSYIL